MSVEILNIHAEESGERIDALLARSLPELSRSAAQRLIEEGRVTLDGRPVKKNRKTEPGEEYEVELPEPALPWELLPGSLPEPPVQPPEPLPVSVPGRSCPLPSSGKALRRLPHI